MVESELGVRVRATTGTGSPPLLARLLVLCDVCDSAPFLSAAAVVAGADASFGATGGGSTPSYLATCSYRAADMKGRPDGRNDSHPLQHYRRPSTRFELAFLLY